MPASDPAATNVDEYVNEALHIIETAAPDGWPWMRREATLTTTASDATYTFPTLGALVASGTVVSKVLGAKVLRGTVYQLLRLMSPDEAVEVYPSTTTGPPEAYFVEGDIFYLYPTPDVAYSIVMRLLIAEGDLSYTTQTPSLPAVFHSAVVDAATMLMVQQLQDAQKAEMYQARVDRAIERMRRYGRPYQAAPKVRVRDWLA